MSTSISRHAKNNDDKEMASQLWKKVNKASLPKLELFKFLSWTGISFF